MTEQNDRLDRPRIETTYLYFWYLLYVLAVIAADWLNFLRFLLLPESHLNFLFLAPLLLVPAYLVSRKYFIFSHMKFTAWDSAGLALLAALALLKLPFPDQNFDTVNYHITLQANRFLNNLSQSFFPGNVMTISSSLGDALFCCPRYILGYRAGTLLNLAVLVILYIQIKALLARPNNAARTTALVSALALLTVTTDFSFLSLSTYMTDFLGAPFVLAAVCLVTGSPEHHGRRLKYLTLLSGICVAVKLTYLPFMVILWFVYLARARKQLRLKDAFPACLAFLLPLSPYYLYAGISTGNPLFPFFNAIFKSPLIRPDSFKDQRWGPKGIWETLIWPVSGILHSGRASELAVNSGRLAFGFVASAVTFGFWSRQLDRRKRLGLVALVLFIGILSWSYSTGYMRYAIPLEVISGLLVSLWIVELFVAGAGRGNKTIATALLLALALQTCFGIVFIIAKNLDWSWRPSLFTDALRYVESMKRVGRDREDHRFPEYSRIKIWATCDNNAGLASLIKPGVDILNIDLGIWETGEMRRLRKQLLQTVVGETVHSVAFEDNLKQVLAKLAAEGFVVERLFLLEHPALNAKQKVIIIRTRYKPGSTARADGPNLLSAPAGSASVLAGSGVRVN